MNAIQDTSTPHSRRADLNQTRLLGMPHGIQGLAIGAFGETGKGISDYFRLLATIATKRADLAASSSEA